MRYILSLYVIHFKGALDSGEATTMNGRRRRRRDRDRGSCLAISHIYKHACNLAQEKALPSLIYHEPALEVRFARGAATRRGFLAIRDFSVISQDRLV